MKQIGVLASFVWLQLLRMRSALLMLYIMPLLLILILGTALSGSDGKGRPDVGAIRLALLAEDNGEIAARFREYVKKGTDLSFEIVEAGSEEELRQMVKSGGAHLGLAVPAGFLRTAEEGRAPVWRLMLGSDPLKNVIGEQAIASFFDGIDQELAMNSLWPGRQSNAGYESGEVRTVAAESGEEPYSSLQYYAAHMLVMFMLYGGMSAALGLVEEKEKHTLMRLRSLPIHPVRLLAGKMAGHFTVIVSQALLIITVSTVLYGVDWGGRPVWLAAVCLAVSVFSVALAAVIGMLAKSSKIVIAVFQTAVVLMTFLSGGFSPMIGSFLAGLGHYTFHYWAAQGLLQLMQGSGWNVLGKHLSVLGAAAAGMCLAAVAVFGKAGYRE